MIMENLHFKQATHFYMLCCRVDSLTECKFVGIYGSLLDFIDKSSINFVSIRFYLHVNLVAAQCNVIAHKAEHELGHVDHYYDSHRFTKFGMCTNSETQLQFNCQTMGTRKYRTLQSTQESDCHSETIT